MTGVLAETHEDELEPEAIVPTGVMAPCDGCGHAHHAHRGASPGTGISVCLAAVPVKRSGDPPGHGEYTTGKGSAHDFTGSVCACNQCRCSNCADPD